MEQHYPSTIAHSPRWAIKWIVGQKAFATDGNSARWPAQVHGYTPGPLQGVWLRFFRQCRGYILVNRESNLEEFNEENRLKIYSADIRKHERSIYDDACRVCRSAPNHVVDLFKGFPVDKVIF